MPPDLKPDKTTLVQIRAQAYGFWPLRKRKAGEPVNIYLGHECICPPLPYRPECPVHGGWGEEEPDVRPDSTEFPETEPAEE